MNSKDHWELIHQTSGFDQLSWFQEEPTMSIDLIRRATSDSRVRIIDVGGGPSSLAEALLREDHCSGLPVVRYSPEELRRELGESFDLIENAKETHVTPSGSRQSFVYCLFRFVPL